MPSIPLPPEAEKLIDALYADHESTTLAAYGSREIGQAAVSAAQQLQRQHDGALDSKRLTAALNLVLINAVATHLNGSATVQSGRRAYSVANGACSCPDHQNRKAICKHMIAVTIHKLAAAMLNGRTTSETHATTEPLPTPASAAWDVSEAPASCYIKFRLGSLELCYTMRGTNDAELSRRLKVILPRIQDRIDAHEEREAERKAIQAEGNGPLPDTPEDDAAPVCPYHGKMRASTKAPGTWFCPSKMGDGSYCKERWPR